MLLESEKEKNKKNFDLVLVYTNGLRSNKGGGSGGGSKNGRRQEEAGLDESTDRPTNCCVS